MCLISYILDLNYDRRTSEKVFMSELLQNFDDVITGSMLFVDNHTRKIKWQLTFHSRKTEFLNWLKSKGKARDIDSEKKEEESPLYFMMQGWNALSIYTPKDVEFMITSDTNGIFLYPEKKK